MDIIELERWRPSKEDPHKREYAGQPTAQEVFEELKHRLDSMGYLPDEYFDLSYGWEDGKEIPKDADIFCTVDYGGSEGVYVDVYLKWYDEAQKKSVTSGFITGKTLGENGNDMDRMNENEYTTFRVRENGRDQSFRLDRRESFLDIAKFLRSYLIHEWPSGPAALEKSFAGLELVSAEQYGQLMELHLEDPNKVTGVYELDFDKREVSTVGMGRSWQTWSMKDVSAAVDFAYQKTTSTRCIIEHASRTT